MGKNDLRWCVFISGRGSNLQFLLENLEDLHIALVVTQSKKAAGILKAKRFSIPVLFLDLKKTTEIEISKKWDGLKNELMRRKINRIFLLGFMRLLPEAFVRTYEDKIFNVHPSLLPLFPGKDAFLRSHQQSLVLKKNLLGATTHVVNQNMDEGEILFQKKISFGPFQMDPVVDMNKHTINFTKLALCERHIVLKTALKQTILKRRVSTDV